MEDDADLERIPHAGGRPAYVPTERERGIVESASAFGISHEDIAKHLGIAPKTLRKYFRIDIDEGVFKTHMKIGRQIVDLALNAQDEKVRLSASQYYAARRMGWKETSKQEQTVQNPDGTAVERKTVIILPDNGRG